MQKPQNVWTEPHTFYYTYKTIAMNLLTNSLKGLTYQIAYITKSVHFYLLFLNWTIYKHNEQNIKQAWWLRLYTWIIHVVSIINGKHTYVNAIYVKQIQISKAKDDTTLRWAMLLKIWPF